MSADRGEVNEWKLQKENKTLFRMCDMLNIVCSQQQQQQQPGFGGGKTACEIVLKWSWKLGVAPLQVCFLL